MRIEEIEALSSVLETLAQKERRRVRIGKLKLYLNDHFSVETLIRFMDSFGLFTYNTTTMHPKIELITQFKRDPRDKLNLPTPNGAGFTLRAKACA